MRDSYEPLFLEGYTTKDEPFEFGLRETIYSPFQNAKLEWETLKERIMTGIQAFIRGFGRDAAGTSLFLNFYKDVLNNSKIKKDPTNNGKHRDAPEILRNSSCGW